MPQMRQRGRPVRRHNVSCATCGALFLPGHAAMRKAEKGLPVYDTRACYVRQSALTRWKDVAQIAEATCPQCQQVFVPSETQKTRMRQGRKVFCSYTCAMAFRKTVDEYGRGEGGPRGA